ncbi:MAG: FkbM family methyltransferase [Bacteroidetes bacterium]|nr:FkbM family methyltransferase [Bacteroidota bacterium]
MKRKFPIRHALISSLLEIDVRGIRKIAYHLPRMLIPAPEGALTMLTRYGFWLHIDPVKDKGVERSIYYTGTYEKGALATMKQLLRPGDCFVDVGANIGLMSIFASTVVGPEGKVLAFEPNPETATILEENIRLNHISNIESFRYAMGKNPGMALIYDRWDSNRGSASLIKPGEEAESHEIEVTTLSDFFRKETDKLPSLIKLDIEGFELEALEGALDLLNSRNPPMLMVECSRTRDNTFGRGSEPLYDFLMGLGPYRIFRGKKEKNRVSKLVEVKNLEELPAHDNIYCLTDTHIQGLSIFE